MSAPAAPPVTMMATPRQRFAPAWRHHLVGVVLSGAMHLGVAATAMTLVPRLPIPENARGGAETVIDAVVIGAEELVASEEGAKPETTASDQPESPPVETASLVTGYPPIPIMPSDRADPAPPVSPVMPMPAAPEATVPPHAAPVAAPKAVAPPPAKRPPPKLRDPAPARETPRRQARPVPEATNPVARGQNGAGEGAANRIAMSRGGLGGVAQVAGTGDLSTYRTRVVAHLTRFKTYPEQAQERGITGRNAITITLSRDGRVSASTLSAPSGHSLLDTATLAALRRAQPFPPMPEGGPATMTVTIGLRYDLR